MIGMLSDGTVSNDSVYNIMLPCAIYATYCTLSVQSSSKPATFDATLAHLALSRKLNSAPTEVSQMKRSPEMSKLMSLMLSSNSDKPPVRCSPLPREIPVGRIIFIQCRHMCCMNWCGSTIETYWNIFSFSMFSNHHRQGWTCANFTTKNWKLQIANQLAYSTICLIIHLNLSYVDPGVSPHHPSGWHLKTQPLTLLQDEAKPRDQKVNRIEHLIRET